MPNRHGSDASPNDQYSFGYQGSEKDGEIHGESYTTHFRQLDTRIARWTSIDPKATAHESPYVSMGNSPISHNDVLGDTITGNLKAYNQYKSTVQTRISGINTDINKVNAKIAKKASKGKTSKRLNNRLSSLKNEKKEYTGILNEMTALENSTQTYNIQTGVSTGAGIGGNLNFDKSTGYVNVNVGSSSNNALGTLAHELKHAYQFETGMLSLSYNGSGGSSLYDIQDEVEAYKRGQLFGYPASTVTVNTKWVQGLKRPNGKPVYPLSSSQLTLSSPMTTGLGKATTYDIEIKTQIYNYGTVGRNPIQVIKDWETYYNQGANGQTFKP